MLQYKKQTSKEDTNMKIKNATIKDFDTAYEYIKKLWDYNTYDYETTKEVYEKVLQDENSFCIFLQ